MKKNLMKSLCLAFMLNGTAMTAIAQGIVVNKTDGSKVYYKASEVQSVGVFDYDEGPDADVHEWVDLGLPSGTLWATCNIGAENPEDFGDYFAWGETIGFNAGKKTNYTWNTYRYCKGSETTMTKYCTDSSYGTVDGKTELDPEDDAATVWWGSKWQMPSAEQMQEIDPSSGYTTKEWAVLNGVVGLKITSKINWNSIFIPSAGYIDDTGYHDINSSGTNRYSYCWTRSLSTDKSSGAYRGLHAIISISAGSSGSGIIQAPTGFYGTRLRFHGLSVRPVRVKE